MHAGTEQWIPVLVDRGTPLSLVFLTLVLVGTLFAAFGGTALVPHRG